MNKLIDLNCDMGESFGLWSFGKDEAMMDFVTSANLACGYHAGDPSTMRKSVELCKERGIAVGAHVGLPDLLGFGRRRMEVSINDLKNYIIYQTGALQAFLDIYGMKMQHMKLHGALFSMAAESKELSRAALEATAEINSELIIFTMESTETYAVAKEMGFKVAREFYGDRGCEPSGILTFKYNLEDIGGSPEASAKRIVRVLEEKRVITSDGTDIDFECETFCIHSDTDCALDIAINTKNELEKAGWSLTPLREYF
ncbi:LamB/YcsF family protein [Bacillus salipaludis]|uniref:LamB/YcsF family protein n=1 Tax=Bacillus salipaludis TaxID=2547811 RepID=A0A4R5VRE6_9BACI|nr:5-oxoprolinase subunit PxpA [Bacillus salipaludis]TDK60959.1 LamB/YcsF family protein [Bacillus salipaludis]